MKDLKINGFSYDGNMIETLNQVYYIRDDNEDDFIAIFEDSENPERSVLVFYVKCEIAFVSTFVGATEHQNIESYINDRLPKYFKD